MDAKKSPTKKLKYDPVVREGTFRVDYKDLKRIYNAVDVAEAKYCLIEEFNLFPPAHTVEQLIEQKELRETILKSITVWCIRKTIRQSDRQAAKRRQQKLNMSSG